MCYKKFQPSCSMNNIPITRFLSCCCCSLAVRPHIVLHPLPKQESFPKETIFFLPPLNVAYQDLE